MNDAITYFPVEQVCFGYNKLHFPKIVRLNLFISHCEKPRNLIVNSFFFFIPVIENSRIPHPNKFTLSTLFPIIRKLAGKRFSKSFC